MKYKYLILFILLLPMPSTAFADATVFAAASLKNALDEISQSCTAQKSGKVEVS